MLTRKLPSVQRGFTLVEILVSIALLALIVGAASVAMWFDSAAKQLDRTCRHFKSTVELVAEEAFLQGVHYGLSLLPGEEYNSWFYQWYVQRDNGRWAPLAGGDDDIFAAKALPGELYLELYREGQVLDIDTRTDSDYPLPQIFFYASGEITPFSLEISDRNNDFTLQLDADLLGRVTIVDSRDES